MKNISSQLLGLENPFARLRSLLGDTKPGASPVDMTIGAPRHPMPDFIGEVLGGALEGFSRYPLITGTDALRGAITNWLKRRYSSLEAISLEERILPLCGSREGLYYAPVIAKERRPDLLEHPAQKPVILIPNPFYQAYAAGTLAAGCEPVYLPCSADNSFLPDLDALDPDVLSRTVAFYLCSPSNPQGAVAGTAYLQKAIQLARKHNFMLFGDECYSEIYRETPPVGLLEAAVALEREESTSPQENMNHGNTKDTFKNLLIFNSLSKRSNLPGLRSGFCAGERDFISLFTRFRNVAAPQLALPVQAVSCAVWDDEAHVVHNRLLYQQKFELADALLTNRFDYSPVQAGFFLWLDFSKNGGGEQAALNLWKGYGVKILPGAFLTQKVEVQESPGASYGRLALVHDLETTEEGLRRLI